MNFNSKNRIALAFLEKEKRDASAPRWFSLKEEDEEKIKGIPLRLWVCLLSSVGIFGKFVGIAWKKRAGFISLTRPAAHLQPPSAPDLYPASHKFIKLFQICGAECGATMPHIRKKDLDFTLNP